MEIQIVVSPVYDVLVAPSNISCGPETENNQKNHDSSSKAGFHPVIKQQDREPEKTEPQYHNYLKSRVRPRLAANLDKYYDPDCYPGVGLLSLEGEKYTRDIPSFIKALYETSDNDLATALLSFGKVYRGNMRVEKRIDELLASRDLLVEHIVQNMSVPPEKVEGLADIIMNLDEARDDLAEIIEHLWYIILPGEIETRAQTQQRIAEQVQTKLAEMGQERFVTELTNLHLQQDGDSYEKVIIAPSSFLGGNMIGTENADETTLIIVIGEQHPILTGGCAEEEKPKPELLAMLYSALGDKTRLEIVRVLAERPHYGQELAKMFGISNATIFYHLSMLQKIDLIILERIEHRVYYALDTQRLGQMLAQGTAYLLN